MPKGINNSVYIGGREERTQSIPPGNKLQKVKTELVLGPVTEQAVFVFRISRGNKSYCKYQNW